MNLRMIFKTIRPHIPGILTGLACVGVPVTAVLASKAGAESARAIDNEMADFNRDPVIKELSKCDMVRICWKNYIPTAIVSGLTIASIIGSNRISAKEIAMLSASCAGLMSTKSQLEQEIRSRYGDEVLNDIRQHAEVLIYSEDTGNGDLLCYDGWGGRWFYSSEDAVNMALCEYNQDFMDGTYLSYNDLYKAWGIAETHFGWSWGYVPDPDYYDMPLMFSVRKVEGFMRLDEPVLVIEPLTYPMQGWLEI